MAAAASPTPEEVIEFEEEDSADLHAAHTADSSSDNSDEEEGDEKPFATSKSPPNLQETHNQSLLLLQKHNRTNAASDLGIQLLTPSQGKTLLKLDVVEATTGVLFTIKPLIEDLADDIEQHQQAGDLIILGIDANHNLKQSMHLPTPCTP